VQNVLVDERDGHAALTDGRRDALDRTESRVDAGRVRPGRHRYRPSQTAEHAAVAPLAPSALRGPAFGLLAATPSFGNIIASAVVGLVWTAVSPTAALLIPAAAMIIAPTVLGTTAQSDRSGRAEMATSAGTVAGSVHPVRNGSAGSDRTERWYQASAVAHEDQGRDTEGPHYAGLPEAAEGTRTLDLLDEKQ